MSEQRAAGGSTERVRRAKAADADMVALQGLTLDVGDALAACLDHCGDVGAACTWRRLETVVPADVSNLLERLFAPADCRSEWDEPSERAAAGGQLYGVVEMHDWLRETEDCLVKTDADVRALARLAPTLLPGLKSFGANCKSMTASVHALRRRLLGTADSPNPYALEAERDTHAASP